MKKYIFLLLFLSLNNLFADEIETLVNELLKEKQTYRPPSKNANYFIQMFVYSKHKPKNLIKKIEQKGYNITIKKARRNDKDVNLVLVGSYENLQKAKKELKVLRTIEKDCFIYKIK